MKNVKVIFKDSKYYGMTGVITDTFQVGVIENGEIVECESFLIELENGEKVELYDYKVTEVNPKEKIKKVTISRTEVKKDNPELMEQLRNQGYEFDHYTNGKEFLWGWAVKADGKLIGHKFELLKNGFQGYLFHGLDGTQIKAPKEKELNAKILAFYNN